MGWLDGWPFTSKEDRERKQKEYSNRVFPFGEGPQRERAAELLGQLFGEARNYDQQTFLFSFIAAKSEYILREKGDAGRARIIPMLKKYMTREKPETVALMVAFIELETEIDSLDGYPTAADVQSRARKITVPK
ncbi:MAG: hypothetical protein LBR44_03945 [Clostridiales Family XIII bacterium]|nr:hypothetical protein [Clostridiales Family XIII bacterium]